MMSKLVFTPLAEDDLQGILGFIAQDRPETAIRIVGEIRNKCEQLARNPHLASGGLMFRRSTGAHPSSGG